MVILRTPARVSIVKYLGENWGSIQIITTTKYTVPVIFLHIYIDTGSLYVKITLKLTI